MKVCLLSARQHYNCRGLVADQDDRSLPRELGTLKEDYADLQDKLDALSHSTSRKLTAPAAELTSHERQVDSPSTELRASHHAVVVHSAEALHLQSAFDTQAKQKRAAGSCSRRAHVPAQHSRQLDVAHTRAMAELGSLIERHTAIEVLLEQNYTLKRRAWTSCARQWYALTRECRQAAHTAAPETPATTLISTTQSLLRCASSMRASSRNSATTSTPPMRYPSLIPAVLDRLKSENAALLQRFSALDQHARTNPHNSDANAKEQLVPRVSWAAVCEEMAQFEAELKQRDKRILCLRQVFVGKTAEFREALSAILGVKLAFYDNGQVRVTSQYDLGAAFIFQPAPKDGSEGGARMQLVAQELPQLMRNWVEIEQSIPCFLASVTLECYDKWKREQQNGRKRD
ncbi:mitotic checkpoint protein-domain-containing protein [Lactarius deliciosus]|nr:mitotic checkpoint protein-domain-containing protein [Lactarius deliciosus]